LGGSVAGESINWEYRVNVVPCLLTWSLIKVCPLKYLTRVIVMSGLTLLGHPSAFLVREFVLFSRLANDSRRGPLSSAYLGKNRESRLTLSATA
jgi:hypothetical protein